MAEKPPSYPLPTREEFAQFARDYFALMDMGNPLTAEARRQAEQDPQERDISPATAALRNQMTPNTVGYVKTMRSVFNDGYVAGTTDRIKDIGDKVADFLKKPQGTLTEADSWALLNEISALGTSGEPLTGMEYINRLSLFMSVGSRAVAEGAISAADYMNRKEFFAIALGSIAVSGDGMRMPTMQPRVDNTLPRASSGVFILREQNINVNPKLLQSQQTRNEMSNSKIDRLAKKMKINGYDGPPIESVKIDGKLIITDGHHRAAAAAKAGLDQVPVTIHRVSPDVAKAIRAAADQARAEQLTRMR